MILGEVFPGEDAEVLVEAIKSDWSGEDEDTIQDLAVWVKHYKETAVQATGATAAWNSDMGQYLITIPSAYVPASGIFDICVKGSDIDDVLIRLQVNTGDAQLTAIKAITDLLTLAAINAEVDTAITDAAIVTKIDTVDTVVDGIATTLATPNNFKADVSSLATSAEISLLNNLSMSDIETACGSAITDAAIVTKIDTVDTVVDGIATTLATPSNFMADVSSLATSAEVAAVGAEKIVPADKYAFDASAKTITLASPYDTLTVEQVTFIKNLTTNYIIWDCRYAGYQTLPIRFGAAPSTHVLYFDSADLDAANEDKIMIVVNQTD